MVNAVCEAHMFNSRGARLVSSLNLRMRGPQIAHGGCSEDAGEALQAILGQRGNQSLILFFLVPSCSSALRGVVAWDGSTSSSCDFSFQ